MHEIAIANKIIQEAKLNGAEKIIQLEVGELAELTAEEVEDALLKLTDMEIRINYKDSKINCACGYEGRARIVDKGHGYCVFNCPKCSSKPQVLEGGGIRITGVE